MWISCGKERLQVRIQLRGFNTMVYITAFRVLMPCGLVGGYQSFRRTS